MSLTVAFNAAQQGISLTEQKMAVTAANINNADKAGYTRKTYQADYIYNGTSSLPIGGKTVSSVAEPLLAKQANDQYTSASNQTTMANYLNSYATAYGGTGGDTTTMSSSLDDLSTSLKALEQNPSSISAKEQVINTAQSVVSQLNAISQNVQTQRYNANTDISTAVANVNTDLQTISDLNTQISSLTAAGQSTADLEDQRATAAQDLSGLMGIQYFTDANNEMLVYTSGGTQIVGRSNASQLSYTPAGSVSSSMTYPANFSAISLNGADITTQLTTGKLGALVDLRDNTMPSEQAKLDALATSLSTTINGALSTGSSVPATNSLTSSAVVTAATSLAGSTGHLRVAVTDASGTVQSLADLDMSTFATVGDLMTALNGMSGVNASLDSAGHLVVQATTSTSGVSMNPLDSNTGGTGVNTSQFFGFNDLFVNPTIAGASGIQVNSSLLRSSAGLATGTLSSSATLAVGDRALASGDASAMTTVLNALVSTQSIPAAGNFASTTSTIASYAAAIIANAAVQAKNAQTSADSATSTYSYLSTQLSNDTGVNVDEETSNLTSLQTIYQANAQIMSTVKDMFAALLQAVQ